MSITSIKAFWLTGLLALVAITSSVSSSSAQTIVGSGDSSSFLVLQAEAFADTPFVFEYRYDYNAAAPFNSYDLLVSVISAQPAFSLSFLNYGTEETPNYFLNSVSYLAPGSDTPIVLTNVGSPNFSPYWVQWVSGGESGYPEAEPISSGAWEYGSGLSTPFRYVQPGSWDGFVYNDGIAPPSISPVPEPSTVILLVIAGGALLLRIHRNARPKNSILAS